MSGVRPIPTDDEMKQLYESFDLNHDRSLSYTEVRTNASPFFSHTKGFVTEWCLF